ncbi:DUF4342 domain-containing protein [Patescibacteria group bacterium]
MSKNEFKVSGEELLKKVKNIVKEGNVRRIVIKNDKGQAYLEIPVTIGVLGALAAPIFVAVGAIAAIASKFTIEVIRSEKKAPAKKVAKKPATKKKK